MARTPLAVDLEGKTAIVTGASAGIGKGLAKRALRQGKWVPAVIVQRVHSEGQSAKRDEVLPFERVRRPLPLRRARAPGWWWAAS